MRSIAFSILVALRRRVVVAPLCVLAVGLAFTSILAVHFHRQVTAAAAHRFERLNSHVVGEAARRVDQVVYGLRAARGVYLASDHVRRSEFHQYIASRDLPLEFPGALGFGFLERVSRDNLPAYIATERADGAPDFSITPSPDIADQTTPVHPELYVVKHLEPHESNRSLLGFDAGSDPLVRRAIEAAIESGQPTITPPVRLSQDANSQLGFLYCLAVYKSATTPETHEDRHGQLQGIIFSPFRLRESLMGIELRINAHLDIQIFDGSKPTSESRIYHGTPAGTAEAGTNPMFRQQSLITVGGRPWTIVASTNRDFDAIVDYSATWIIAICGVAFSMLSAFGTYYMRTSRDRALALARSMTADLTRLAMVAQHTTNAVIITDQNSRITWANDGFTRITGYELSEVVGRVPGHVLQCPNTDPAAVELIRKAIRKAVGCRTEILNRSKAGREYYLDLEMQPIRDPAGNLTGFIAIESDVTEAVLQRQALAEQVSKLEEAEALADMGHWSWDTATGKVAWSKQIFVIHRREPASGVPEYADMLALYSPESAAILDKAIQTALDTGAPYHVTLRTSDHDERYLETAGRVRRDPTGQVAALYGTVRDVTTQVLTDRKLNDALAAAEAATQAKSEFLANMSHEIRTPMTAILGYTELLADDSEAARRPEYIEIIRRNGEHLLAIINDILDLSKIEAGKLTVERIPTSVVQIFHDVLSVMRVKADEKKIALSLSCTTDIPSTIQTDQVRLHQILVNLVANALKFTDTGGVSITAGLLPNSVLQVSITDTGIGMTEEQMSRLFGAFQQADASTTRKFGGTGLGLRISKMLSQLLGGDITVTSIPGQGSTFTATFQTGDTTSVPMISAATAMLAVHTADRPADNAEDTPATPAADGTATAPATTPADHHLDHYADHHSAPDTATHAVPLVSAYSPLSGLRILLAEDGIDNQRLISFHLQKAGAQVTIADNGRIALNHLTVTTPSGLSLAPAAPFDLLLTDMQMPEMDGYTLASTLRCLGSKLPILALTAHAMSGDAQRCLDAGCDAYSSKPINRNQLIQLCATHARRPTVASAA